MSIFGGKNQVVVVIAGENKTDAVFSQVSRALQTVKSHGEGLNSIFTKLAGLVSVGFLTKLVKDSIETAAGMSHLSEKTGLTTEYLSGLSYAARMVDVDQDKLAKGLKFLAYTLQDAANGGEKSQAALAKVGITAADLQKGKIIPLDQAIGRIANRFKESADGSGKMSEAAALMGKRVGPDLIPLFNQGAEGIKKFADEAARAGKIIKSEDAVAAEEAEQKFKTLKETAEGLAMAFGRGVVTATRDLSAELMNPDGFEAFEKLGEGLVKTLRTMYLGIEAVAFAAKSLGGMLALVGASGAGTGFEQGVPTAAEVEDEIKPGLDEAYKNLVIHFDEIFPDEELTKLRAKMDKAVAAAKLAKDKLKATDLGELPDKDAQASDKARTARKVQALKDEAKLTKEAAEREVEDLAWGHDQALVGEQAYFLQRMAIMTNAYSKEYDALKAEYDAEKALADRSVGAQKEDALKKAGEIQTAMQQLSVKMGDAAKKYFREFQAGLYDYKALNDKIEDDIAAAKGRTAQAAMRAIDLEYDYKRAKIQANGGDTGALDEWARMAKAAAMAQELQGQIDLVFGDLNIAVTSVNDAVARGDEYALAGNERLNEAYTRTADKLREIAAEYRAWADESGDPRLKQAADALEAQIENLSRGYKKIGSELRGETADSVQGFMSDLIVAPDKAGDAWDQFAERMKRSIANIVSQFLTLMIYQKLLGGLFDKLGGVSNGITGLPSMTGGQAAWVLGGLIPLLGVGGPMQPGKVYIAGDQGPEPIVVGAPSYAVAQGVIGGGGGAPSVQVILENKSSAQIKATPKSSRAEARRAVVALVLEDVEQGGPMYHALKGGKG